MVGDGGGSLITPIMDFREERRGGNECLKERLRGHLFNLFAPAA